MKNLALIILTFTQINVYAASKSQELGNLFAALSSVIQKNSQVNGVQEKEALLTPDSKNVLNKLDNDLDTCKTEQIKKPEIVEVNQDGVSFKIKNMHIVVDGDLCPLRLEVKVDTKESESNNLKGDIFVKISFKNEELVQKYKLNYAEMNGVIQAQAIKTEDGNINLKAQVKLDTKGKAIEVGDFKQDVGINIDVNVNLSTFQIGMLFEQVGNLSYQDVNDRLYGRTEMKGFGSVTEYYSINEKQVSQTEYQKFLEGFIVPGMVAEENNQNPDGNILSDCKYFIYQKNQTTADAVKSFLNANQPSTVGLVYSGHTCGKNSSTSFQYNETTYTNQLRFEKNWIVLEGSYLSDTEKSLTYVLYKDIEPTVTESNEFLTGLICKPVVKCD